VAFRRRLWPGVSLVTACGERVEWRTARQYGQPAGGLGDAYQRPHLNQRREKLPRRGHGETTRCPNTPGLDGPRQNTYYALIVGGLQPAVNGPPAADLQVGAGTDGPDSWNPGAWRRPRAKVEARTGSAGNVHIQSGMKFEGRHPDTTKDVKVRIERSPTTRPRYCPTAAGLYFPQLT